jgi:hypothetical protein
VSEVSERVCPNTWTCRLTPRDERLLNLETVSRAVRAVGDPFRVRGVEATVDGDLLRAGGRLALRISRSRDLLRLAPLGHKVQWDRRGNREQAPTDEERSAYARLVHGRRSPSRRVRVVGPLVAARDGKPIVLQIRQFFWLKGRR